MNSPKSSHHKKYKPFIISGCSGVGKGTLINSLIQSFPELFELSVSYTTRAPRPGEVHGKHYFFIKKEQFQKVQCRKFSQLVKEIFFRIVKYTETIMGHRKALSIMLSARGRFACQTSIYKEVRKLINFIQSGTIYLLSLLQSNLCSKD